MSVKLLKKATKLVNLNPVAPDYDWKYYVKIDVDKHVEHSYYDYDSSHYNLSDSNDSWHPSPSYESISNVSILNGVQPETLVQMICKKSDKNIMRKYAVDRMLRAIGIYKPDKFESNVYSDYYSDSYDIKFKPDFYDTLMKHIKFIDTADTKGLVELVLELEYGYLLDWIKNFEWEVKKIKLNEIIIPNENYIKKVSKTDNIYKEIDLKLPIGVYAAKKSSSGSIMYYLIDGYHRYVSAIKAKPKSVLAITGANPEEE